MPGCAGQVERAREAGQTSRGLRDLAGNLREWVQDVYATAYGADLENPCERCTEAPAAPRVTRGGSYRQEPSKLRVWARWSEDPAHHDELTIGDVGFRCAADPAD
jgi:formylglycine-generating enzyme required for sulfatase activity